MPELIRITEIKLRWFGTADDGKQLELFTENPNAIYPLATIIADDDERLFLEIYSDGNLIQMPVDQIQQAFQKAEGEVHSEKWYEQNVYPKSDDTQPPTA